MNECQKYHPLLPQYLEGDLSAKDKRLVAWHLNQCADARKELHKAEQLRKRLMELPEPVFPSRLHDRIMNGIYRPQLLATEKKSEKAAVRGKEFPIPSVLFKPAWGLAAAAVFVFVFFALNPEWIRKVGFQRPAFLDPGRLASADRAEYASEAPVQGFPDEAEPAGSVPGIGESAGVRDAEREKTEADALAEQEARDAREKALLAVNAEKKAVASAPAAAPAVAPKAAVQQAAAPKPKRKAAKRAAPNALVPAMAAMPKGGAAQPSQEAVPPADSGNDEVLRLLQESGMAQGGTASTAAAFDTTATGRLDRPELPRWSGPNARASTTTQEVITDLQTLGVYWTLLNPGEPPPAVDFNTQAVVVLVADQKPTAGWRITLDRADVTSMNTVVWYREEGPAPDGMVAQVITRPWSLQVIDKPAKPVVFKKRD